MQDGGPRPRWLFRYGAWIRRALLGVAISIPFVMKAAGLPNHAPAARFLLFVVLGLCGLSFLLYLIEYLLAVRHRGYWFDHHFD